MRFWISKNSECSVREQLATGMFVVTDAAVAQEMPEGSRAHVFRVVADSSVAELRRLTCHS
jgi:hypothetical protein